jgi:hypothetical protein
VAHISTASQIRETIAPLLEAEELLSALDAQPLQIVAVGIVLVVVPQVPCVITLIIVFFMWDAVQAKSIVTVVVRL